MNSKYGFSISIILSALFFENICFLSSTAQKTPNLVFSALAPKVVQPNSVYNVALFVEPIKDASVVTFYSTMTCGSVQFSSQEVLVTPGTGKLMDLKPKGSLPSETCTLKIKGRDQQNVDYEDTRTIFVDNRQLTVFIQTDKPVYKPGETVFFRVVTLDRSLRPDPQKSLEITVFDSQRNVVKKLANVTSSGGLYSSKLSLSTEPNLGDWTIEVSTSGQMDSVSFTIDQYVLPKFKVEVVLPPYILATDKSFKAEVKAKYTYGKGVKGKVEVMVTGTSDSYPFSGVVTVHNNNNMKSVIDGSTFVDLTVPSFTSKSEVNMQVTVKATVIEDLTGKEQSDSATTGVYEHPYKIEWIDKPSNYKPGFPLAITLMVTTPNDIPISDTRADAIKISHDGYSKTKESHATSAIPSTGIVKFFLNTPAIDNNGIYNFQVTYKELKQSFPLPTRMESSTKTYLQLTKVEDTKENRYQFNVKCNKPFDSLNWIMFCRGKIIHQAQLMVPAKMEKLVSGPLKTDVICSKVTIVAYAVFKPTNDVIVDSLTFTAGKRKLDNYLNMTLANATVQPGESAKLELMTNKGSKIALRGVDQSVLLLKGDKNIDRERINKELASFDAEVEKHKTHGDMNNAFGVFDGAGLIVLTNGVVEQFRRWDWDWPRRDGMMRRKGAGPPLMMAMAMADDAPVLAMEGAVAPLVMDSMARSEEKSVAPEVKVRKNFPETWLWTELDATGNVMSFVKEVPDTLTSWIISGFSLHPSFGIGVSESVTLTTFRPFFISLNLPYSVVKGEILALQVLVQNYMAKGLPAQVTFDNADRDFDLNNVQDPSKEVQKVFAPSDQVSQVTFIITPTKIGTFKLNLKAILGDVAGDALSQPLIVKPPGHKILKNKALLVNLKDGKPFNENVTVDLPVQHVPNSEYVKVAVVADLLGSTMANLDSLIQLPCGCGEQNMLYLVPDIVVLDYLTVTKSLNAQIKSKAISFLESGYQRELTYRHSDGSFSAFGNSDPQGSTWLTAFVVRAFIDATKYISVDMSVIEQALTFLSSRQQSVGNFEELGRVIHSDMQGGSATGGLALTAYVTLAFIEASNHFEQFKTQFSKVQAQALKYIEVESRVNPSLGSAYAVVLVTYTLHLAKNPVKEIMFGSMEKLKQKDGDKTFWSGISKAPNPQSVGCCGFEPNPVSVEMTSYALLTYVLRNDLADSASIGKWLLAQRNSQGGFLSTQDTVVGLTALAKFAALTRAPDTSLSITITHSDSAKNGPINFEVTPENAIVLQEATLPTTTKWVVFQATGKGVAMVQLSWFYYVDDKMLEPAFSLDVEVKKTEQPGTMNLTVCTSYLDSASKESNMAVMEINLPSGFTFDAYDFDFMKSIDRVKRYELSDADTKLSVYFNSLVTSKQVCLEAPSHRVFQVANSAPAVIVIYDYYDTTRKARAFYTPPQYSLCDICAQGSLSCRC